MQHLGGEEGTGSCALGGLITRGACAVAGEGVEGAGGKVAVSKEGVPEITGCRDASKHTSALRQWPLSHPTILCFPALPGLRTAKWDRFAARMRGYGSIWCCVHAHPGHIHYDLLWDVPHVDKFNRVWNGTWEVKTGP